MRISILLPTLLILVLCVSCGGGDGTPAESVASAQPAPAASGCGRPTTPGLSLASIDSAGGKRTYRLYVPAGYEPGRPAPLVLNFHGFGSNAVEQEAYTRMQAQADEAGFVTVAADGTGAPQQRWYIYGQGEPGYVDDFAFVDDLLDHLQATLCIDEARIYSTGMSNGAGLSSQLGCRLNDRLAAIAPVAGSPHSATLCKGKAPMPAIIFHGTEDASVPFAGGAGGRLGLAVRGARENARDWAAHNGCASAPTVERVASDVLRESFDGCRGGADVVLYVVEGGGHTWPGAPNVPRLGPVTGSIDATELIWQFFAAHPRPD